MSVTIYYRRRVWEDGSDIPYTFEEKYGPSDNEGDALVDLLQQWNDGVFSIEYGEGFVMVPKKDIYIVRVESPSAPKGYKPQSKVTVYLNNSNIIYKGVSATEKIGTYASIQMMWKSGMLFIRDAEYSNIVWGIPTDIVLYIKVEDY